MKHFKKKSLLSLVPRISPLVSMFDWRPTASPETLRLRARLLARVREFFARRNVLEVETPVLASAAATDPNLDSLSTQYSGPRERLLYLHTSPEFFMKRLLAAGSGDIFQICKVFRDREAGRRHNPEFTLLEWYRIGFDHLRIMDEVAVLLAYVLDGMIPLAESEKLTYSEMFQQYCGIDPHAANTNALAECARRHGADAPQGLSLKDIDGWRDLILTHVIEPQLGRGRLTLVYDYPASQAALSRVRPGPPPLAERFEAYCNGIELANGFHELSDPAEQRRRFERDLTMRRTLKRPGVPIDTGFIAALHQGLPDCAGVALGIDRLVMLAAGARSLADVISFSVDRI
jgi:lysyl-tRNA synthetase class 2